VARRGITLNIYNYDDVLMANYSNDKHHITRGDTQGQTGDRQKSHPTNIITSISVVTVLPYLLSSQIYRDRHIDLAQQDLGQTDRTGDEHFGMLIINGTCLFATCKQKRH
jgi:hypothetical protein